jgi:hypothetical protein
MDGWTPDGSRTSTPNDVVLWGASNESWTERADASIFPLDGIVDLLENSFFHCILRRHGQFCMGRKRLVL